MATVDKLEPFALGELGVGDDQLVDAVAVDQNLADVGNRAEWRQQPADLRAAGAIATGPTTSTVAGERTPTSSVSMGEPSSACCSSRTIGTPRRSQPRAATAPGDPPGSCHVVGDDGETARRADGEPSEP